MNRHWHRPQRTCALFALGLGLLAFLAFWFLLGWRWDWAWWTGFSISTFLVYGFDKMQAGKVNGQRIPEAVLHLLALTGGVPGAWLGRCLFRHKTRHAAFTIVLILATALHLALWWFGLRRH